jgi:sulfite reductase (NADPH) hemoprotein beta-component
MYRCDEFDETFVRERVRQFRGQVERRLEGALSEDEFRPLRLKNGLYLQLHAYMLRVAIPYGVLSSRQMRQLAMIARRFDRGYAHFTTRQNVQYNWPKLGDVPDILEALADVEMHALQTSGNCIRNVTADQFAGVARDEIADPRPWSELIRQWSSLHPEFSYLPRKFKIAVSGSPHDRAALRVHDIGLRLVRNEEGALGFEVMVGGGQGRTPVLAVTIASFVPAADILPYCEAVVRVYNMQGRRDNIYKARIKILVQALGASEYARLVAEEFEKIKGTPLGHVPEEEIARIARYFAPPAYDALPDDSPELEAAQRMDLGFARWCRTNLWPHRVPGYRIVTVSLKTPGAVPGDASADQMDALAALAQEFSADEIRVTHHQNLVLPNVRARDLPAVYDKLRAIGLAAGNIGLISDIIVCPGLDYCNLANARSIPIAQKIARRFDDPAMLATIGELRLNISGCINACGHHHVGHIGILGVDKQGQELYQLTLGGSSAEDASIGKIMGPGFPADDVPDAIARLIDSYLAHRSSSEERFLDCYRRIGAEPFKRALYDGHS